MEGRKNARVYGVAAIAAVAAFGLSGCKEKPSLIANVGENQKSYKTVLNPSGDGFSGSDQELERRLALFLTNVEVANPSGSFEIAVGSVLVARKVEALNSKMDRVASLLETQNRLLEQLLQQQRGR
jgi:hypothetical protein